MEAATARWHPWRLAAALLAVLPLLWFVLPSPPAPLRAEHVAPPRAPGAPDLGRPLDWPLPSRVPLAQVMFTFQKAYRRPELAPLFTLGAPVEPVTFGPFNTVFSAIA